MRRVTDRRRGGALDLPGRVRYSSNGFKGPDGGGDAWRTHGVGYDLAVPGSASPGANSGPADGGGLAAGRASDAGAGAGSVSVADGAAGPPQPRAVGGAGASHVCSS